MHHDSKLEVLNRICLSSDKCTFFSFSSFLHYMYMVIYLYFRKGNQKLGLMKRALEETEVNQYSANTYLKNVVREVSTIPSFVVDKNERGHKIVIMVGVIIEVNDDTSELFLTLIFLSRLRRWQMRGTHLRRLRTPRSVRNRKRLTES